MATDLTVNLPWQQLANASGALGTLGQNPDQAMANLGPAYQQQYNAALNMNANLFQGLQGGYQGLRDEANQRYSNIAQGYQNLSGDVLGRIAGTNQSNITDINTQYNALAGQGVQDLVSRGLGNSTLQGNLERSIALDRSRAITNSQNQFAQLGAGYQSAIGQQGLMAQQQGAQTGIGLGQQQLGMLERVQAPYPQASTYTQLAQMYGAQKEAAANRQQAQQALLNLNGRRGFSQSGVGVGGATMGSPLRPGAFDYSRGYGSGPSATVNPVYGFAGMGGYGVNPAALTTAANNGFNSGNYQGLPDVAMGNWGEEEPIDNTSGEDLSWINQLAI